MIPYVAEVRMKIYHPSSICFMRCVLRIKTVDTTFGKYKDGDEGALLSDGGPQ